MIVKGRIAKTTHWLYIDGISVINRHTSDNKENKERDYISFVNDVGSHELRIFDYDRLYIMNDEGKTIETLRSV